MKKFGFLTFVGLAAMVVSCGSKTMTKDDAIKILEGNTVEKAEEALGKTVKLKLVDKIEKATGAFAEGGAFYSMVANYSNKEAEREIPTSTLFFTVEKLEAFYANQSQDLDIKIEPNGKNGIKVTVGNSKSQSQGGITMKMNQQIVDTINDYGVIDFEENKIEISCSGQISGEFLYTETLTATFAK